MAQKDLIKGLTFMTLRSIGGLGKRQNDVIFSSSVSADTLNQQGQVRDSSLPARRHVVFFPGDIQNFHKAMIDHPVNQMWSRWSYENTCALLHRRFLNCYVWLIIPSRIHEGTFSCYDNFLPSTMFGAPAGFENFDGLLHLRNLLLSAIQTVNYQKNVPSVFPISKDSPLVIVAFSKGCVVLNQFVSELELSKTNPDLVDFLKLTSALYWLDAGHNLTSRVWITDKTLLQRLTDLNVKIQVHVSPRQVNDPGRPHIGEEQRLFVDLLKYQGANVEETLHFADEERCMEQHFCILEEF